MYNLLHLFRFYFFSEILSKYPQSLHWNPMMSTWQVRQQIFVLVVVGFCIGFVHKVSSLCDSLIRHQVPPHVILFLELPDNASSSSSSIFPAAPSFPSGSSVHLTNKLINHIPLEYGISRRPLALLESRNNLHTLQR